MNRVLAWAAAAALGLAACSSSVGPTAGQRSSGKIAQEKSVRQGAGEVAPAGTATSPLDGAGGIALGAGQSPTGTQAGTSLPQGAPGGVGLGGSRDAGYGPPGQGVAPSTLKIGVWVLDTDAACNAIGAAGTTPGGCGARDHVVEVNALTKWVNSHGGIAGHKLQVVIHKTLANNSSWAAQAQSACERFAVDEKVFLGIGEPGHGRSDFARCMAARGVPVIDPSPWPYDKKDYQELSPYLYQPSRPVVERWMKAYVDGLARRGFFKGDAKVGLFRYDSPTHTRGTKNVLLPLLAAHGIKHVEEAVIRTPPSVAALSDMNAELSSHILRFKTANVNRVLFFAGTGEFHIFYFAQAESQGFRPRYGLSSYDYLTLTSTRAPKAQLDGAVAVGWAPGFDTPPEKDPGLGSGAKTCLAAMTKSGVQDPWHGRNVKCDAFFLLKQALDRAPALNVGGFRAAVEALGKVFEPAATFAATFGPGRYDGPSTWRYLTYYPPCSCFAYEGGSNSF